MNSIFLQALLGYRYFSLQRKPNGSHIQGHTPGVFNSIFVLTGRLGMHKHTHGIIIITIKSFLYKTSRNAKCNAFCIYINANFKNFMKNRVT